MVTHEPTRRICGSDCHAAHLPGLLPERSWRTIIRNLDDHFGEVVDVDEETRMSIENYLTRNAAEYVDSKISIRTLESLGNAEPGRITETPYFNRQHKDIPESVIRHDAIRTLSNCQSCHKGSEKTGSFDDDDIWMPRH